VPYADEAHAGANLRLSPRLQQKLRDNMARIDAALPSANADNGLPIRVFELSTDQRAIEVAAMVYERGFYTSAVFFPIVAQGCAGLRAMGRADLQEADLAAFCDAMADAKAMEGM
jgi:7-keto-8-aminopelargonate synthetase-like enzyme